MENIRWKVPNKAYYFIWSETLKLVAVKKSALHIIHYGLKYPASFLIPLLQILAFLGILVSTYRTYDCYQASVFFLQM
jgi:hypothetical protein